VPNRSALRIADTMSLAQELCSQSRQKVPDCYGTYLRYFQSARKIITVCRSTLPSSFARRIRHSKLLPSRRASDRFRVCPLHSKSIEMLRSRTGERADTTDTCLTVGRSLDDHTSRPQTIPTPHVRSEDPHRTSAQPGEVADFIARSTSPLRKTQLISILLRQ